MTHRNHVTWEWLQSKCRWDENLHKFEEVVKETDVCQNQNGFSKSLRKKIWDVGREKIAVWEKTLNETQNWQKCTRKRNLWLLWTEECRSVNGACPRMRVNSVGRGRRRDRRGVVGRILRRTRWRKGWGLRIHRRRLATERKWPEVPCDRCNSVLTTRFLKVALATNRDSVLV